ncbi:hypothetical protein BIY37_01025 [Candidatus Brocadia sapporoensis]|jgi:tetratricopeptide (TPR) repeat protein|uniref:Uncharacterized protein n=1 Tax=Candidatus Brocadia sapporoensis TaxID=392547 RepID=A0A1V6M3D2_9BACT|nr:hypothetical protein [Candidatus Brocadia sapporoensis]MDG6005492.1 hypothetical protein [Candidatus Brocadia sp.]OQZ04569.1 MAG: hypothetical protein B6D34_03240 [Candidatus Brocadia sp. UTAMX1]RZV57665.1 MAG: hypothetical protein EX330_08785 [Candidatus Brocadia sp. BROELEC01]TWU52973.1 hypothetical protein B188_09360 [Candidatus Brocadiaceae bacterium B188]MBW7898721.1 hypothetical protein [Candidatus Brocadia sapporoensis]
MFRKKIVTGFILITACFLVLYSYGYYKKYKTLSLLDGKIKMGKYKDALASVQKLQESLVIRMVLKLEKEDPMIAYNKGVVYVLMENKKKASAEFRKAMETNDPLLKARAIYNTANIIAADMDFSTAAMQYAEVLKINPDDFQAKKNLERMRFGEQQFNTMFSPEQQEREDRIEALKLLPWGTKYKYSGEQKIRW